MSRYMRVGDDMDDTAIAIVEALNNEDFWSATALMGGLSPSEISVVSQKAIDLGANAATIAEIRASVGKTEVINIVDKAPVASSGFRMPIWGWVILVAGIGYYANKKKWFR